MERRVVVSRDFLKLARAYVEALVHPSARVDARVFARHVFFIASRLSVSLIACAAIPICLAVRGVPSAAEGVVYAWLALPLFLALYVSRRGALEPAELLSIASLAAPAGFLAVNGGLGAVPLYASIIPLEAILLCSRRTAFLAALISGISFACGWGFAAALPVLHLPDPAAVSAIAGVVVAGYFGLIAIAGRAIYGADLARESARIARYRLIAENTGELVTRHGRNGAVTFTSPAAETLLGAPASALAGHGFFDRIHVADRPAFLTALSEAAIAARPTLVEYRLRREPTGAETAPTFIWVETRCKPDDAALAGKPQVIAVTRNISGRKAAEIALGEARAQAEQANEAKYRFLATVSHELRTPLNAIIGFSEILTNPSDGAGSSFQREYAKLIRDSGEHLLAVVDSILEVSRIESAQFMIRPKVFLPADLIASCIEMMGLTAKAKGVRLAAEFKALPEIVADERALRQVMLNLLSNAIKFTGHGGKVVLSARAEEKEFVFTVADSGIGISEADLKQLGNPFFQVHATYNRPYEGSGLGLSVVKGLVGLHGGKVEIASRPGEGTKVTVRVLLDCRGPAAPDIETRHSEKVRRRA